MNGSLTLGKTPELIVGKLLNTNNMSSIHSDGHFKSLTSSLVLTLNLKVYFTVKPVLNARSNEVTAFQITLLKQQLSGNPTITVVFLTLVDHTHV